jgi:anti-anti-sigma factor
LKLDLETRAIDGVTVLCCKGRLTYHDEALVFSQKIAELLPHTCQLVIELSGMEMIDNAGLGELVVVQMWARASGCAIKLAAASDQVRELFERTNLTSVLEVHSTLHDALLSCHEIASSKKASHAA